MEDQHNELKASLHVSLRELYGQDAQFRNFQLKVELLQRFEFPQIGAQTRGNTRELTSRAYLCAI